MKVINFLSKSLNGAISEDYSLWARLIGKKSM